MHADDNDIVEELPVAPLTACQRLRSSAVSNGVGAHQPQCTADGAFEPVQCRDSTGVQCWCVNSNGVEIYGTRSRATKPNCSGNLRLCLGFEVFGKSKIDQNFSRIFSGKFGMVPIFKYEQLYILKFGFEIRLFS